MAPIRIIIAEDHALVRAGFKALLQSQPGLEVVAEADNGRTAVTLTEKFNPDILILDLSMPQLNGLEVIGLVKQVHPQLHVIVVTMHNNEEYILQAMRAGADGYLLKDAGSEELVDAIQAVLQNDKYLSVHLRKQALMEYLNQTGDLKSALDLLTLRQREVLKLLAEGISTQAIAKHLSISAKTVEAHRSQIMDRLGIYDVVSLTHFAIRTGLVWVDR
jgi:DNA-binding NarL/FixJ family response regulator